MANITADWGPLGKNVYYRKFELFTMNWNKSINLSEYIIACGQYGGPIAMVKDTKVIRNTELKPEIYIYTAAGNKMSSIVWKSSKLMFMAWTTAEDLLCIQDNGVVLVYDIFGNFDKNFSIILSSSPSFKVLDCRFFSSSQGTGIAILGNDLKFYYIADIINKKERQLKQLEGLESIPSSWTVLTAEKEIIFIVAQDTTIDMISSFQSEWTKMKIEFNKPMVSITEIAVSINQQHIALLSDQGALWIGSSDLKRKYCEFDTSCKSKPKQLLWCGNGAVVCYWENLLLVVGPEKDWLNYILDSPSYLVPEIDGIRIIGSETHELFQKVPSVVADIFKIAFIAPGAWLLEASKEFRKKSHKADDFLRMIKEKNQLELAVTQCIEAAGHEFNPTIQKMLLRAASFGKCFIPELNPGPFVEVSKKLRVLNAMRLFNIALPITFTQLEHLTIPVLINRLVLRRHYCLAISICQYLKIPEREGSSQVLSQWAFYKVNQTQLNSHILARQIADKIGNAPGVSYSDIAEVAIDKGFKDLGINLLEYETQASQQVLLLTKLKQITQALCKAMESGDSDLVYHVIFTLDQPSKDHTANILFTIKNYETAMNLYIKYLKQANLKDLDDVFYQTDNFLGRANNQIFEAYKTQKIELRMSCLKEAVGYYKQAKTDFFVTQTEDHILLLNHQRAFEEEFKGDYLHLSVHDTLSKLLAEKRTKQVEQMRKDFRIPDRRFWWLKIQILSKSGDWGELDRFSKSKKSPIGYEPFIDVCLKYDNKLEAQKYVTKVREDNKIRYLVKVGLLEDAYKVALEQKDVEALNFIRNACGACNRILADKISISVSQLVG